MQSEAGGTPVNPEYARLQSAEVGFAHSLHWNSLLCTFLFDLTAYTLFAKKFGYFMKYARSITVSVFIEACVYYWIIFKASVFI